MQVVDIVEYLPSHAQALADMWNRSSSGWNGKVFNSTLEKVRQDAENTSYLNLYLAVTGDLVIGYAKFTLYAEEKGVSYIEMLSVDPEWHGKGVGKLLVKQCVQKAIDMGYDRIDLFTWAANTKAVPLYKKCGFFWEDMETNVTHLMNFLPSILNNELLKPYFEVLDWYDDAIRDLAIAPDGRDDKGFELYDYIWQKGDLRLQVTYERRGRGIVQVITPSFDISTHITDAEPVFGTAYGIRYKLEFHPETSVDLRITGRDDGNIDYKYEYAGTVSGKKKLKSKFLINPIEEELNEWRTAPGVVSEVSINGKILRMKTGLKVQFPLSTTIGAASNSLFVPGQDGSLFLNVENNLPVACTCQIDVSGMEPVTLQNSHFMIYLLPQEKSFLQLVVNSPVASIVHPLIAIRAFTDLEEEFEFVTRASFEMKMLNSMAFKDLGDRVYMVCGALTMQIYHVSQKNRGYLGSIYGGYFQFMAPQIGKPYSEEFDQEMPIATQITDLGNALEMVLTYQSSEHPGLEFARVYRLFPGGLMECRIRIIKLPESAQDIYTNIKVGTASKGMSFRSEGKILSLESDLPGTHLDDFDNVEIGANWVFTKDDDSFNAIIWPPAWKAMVDNYCMNWEFNLSQYYRQGMLETEALCFYLDVFRNALQVRNVAEGMAVRSEQIIPTLELVINGGNPIVNVPYQVELVQHRNVDLKGEYGLFIQDESNTIGTPYSIAESGVRRLTWSIDTPQRPMEIISCKAEMPVHDVLRQQVACCSTGEVRIYNGSSDQSIHADNGTIKIVGALDAKLPGLISIVHDGLEWLDSGYPDFAPKSFYNPYQGGMGISPTMLNLNLLSQESHHIEAAQLDDQWGNTWSGFVIHTEIKSEHRFDGLAYRQYYLMLPGVPVIAVQTELCHGTGKAVYNFFQMNTSFRNDGGKLMNKIGYPDDKKGWIFLRGGSESVYLSDYYASIVMMNQQSRERMYIMTLNRASHTFRIDPLVMQDSLRIYSDILPSHHQWLTPIFVMFDERELRHEWCGALLDTKFGLQKNL